MGVGVIWPGGSVYVARYIGLYDTGQLVEWLHAAQRSSFHNINFHSSLFFSYLKIKWAWAFYAAVRSQKRLSDG